MLTVFSYGEVLIDLIPTKSDIYCPFVGGAPANVSAAIAKLGGQSFFVGGISEDGFGQKIQAELTNSGVQFFSALKSNEKTAMVVVSLDSKGERSFQFYRDNTADLDVSCEQIDQLPWHQADIFHFCSNTLTDEKCAASTYLAIANAATVGALISFDVNLRLNLWPCDSDQQILERFYRAAKSSHIIKFSKEELQFLSGASQLTEEQMISALLTSDTELVVVTDGQEPVQVKAKQFSFELLPPKVEAVDTTAGGDSFIGGLLYQLSQRDKSSLFDALADESVLTSIIGFATRCGAHTVARKGAILALPVAKDLLS